MLDPEKAFGHLNRRSRPWQWLIRYTLAVPAVLTSSTSNAFQPIELIVEPYTQLKEPTWLFSELYQSMLAAPPYNKSFAKVGNLAIYGLFDQRENSSSSKLIEQLSVHAPALGKFLREVNSKFSRDTLQSLLGLLHTHEGLVPILNDLPSIQGLGQGQPLEPNDSTVHFLTWLGSSIAPAYNGLLQPFQGDHRTLIRTLLSLHQMLSETMQTALVNVLLNTPQALLPLCNETPYLVWLDSLSATISPTVSQLESIITTALEFVENQQGLNRQRFLLYIVRILFNEFHALFPTADITPGTYPNIELVIQGYLSEQQGIPSEQCPGFVPLFLVLITSQQGLLAVINGSPGPVTSGPTLYGHFMRQLDEAISNGLTQLVGFIHFLLNNPVYIAQAISAFNRNPDPELLFAMLFSVSGDPSNFESILDTLLQVPTYSQQSSAEGSPMISAPLPSPDWSHWISHNPLDQADPSSPTIPGALLSAMSLLFESAPEQHQVLVQVPEALTVIDSLLHTLELSEDYKVLVLNVAADTVQLIEGFNKQQFLLRLLGNWVRANIPPFSKEMLSELQRSYSKLIPIFVSILRRILGDGTSETSYQHIATGLALVLAEFQSVFGCLQSTHHAIDNISARPLMAALLNAAGQPGLEHTLELLLFNPLMVSPLNQLAQDNPDTFSQVLNILSNVNGSYLQRLAGWQMQIFLQGLPIYISQNCMTTSVNPLLQQLVQETLEPIIPTSEEVAHTVAVLIQSLFPNTAYINDKDWLKSELEMQLFRPH